MANFDDLRCASVDQRCEICPARTLRDSSPRTAAHLEALINTFGLDGLSNTLAGETMPTKFIHLVTKTEVSLPDLPRAPGIDEEHVLADSMKFIIMCRYNSTGE